MVLFGDEQNLKNENNSGGKLIMRKKALVIAAAAALMTLSTGITAFAAGWVKEDTTYGAKWKYVYDNGDWPSGNWFTPWRSSYSSNLTNFNNLWRNNFHFIANIG